MNSGKYKRAGFSGNSLKLQNAENVVVKEKLGIKGGMTDGDVWRCNIGSRFAFIPGTLMFQRTYR